MTPVRWSNLKWMMRSPAHYRYYFEHPQEETPAMRIGGLIHSLLLGGPHKYVTYNGTRRGAAWDEFREQTGGKVTVVSRQESDTAEACVAALKADELAMSVIDGHRERTIEWVSDGITCIGTPDVTNKFKIVELKVTDIGPDRLVWHAQRMGWLGQISWYEMGLDFERVPAHYIVTVSPKPPHLVTTYYLTDNAKMAGKKLAVSLWERFKVHYHADEWPGYGQTMQALDVPADDDITLTIDGEDHEL